MALSRCISFLPLLVALTSLIPNQPARAQDAAKGEKVHFLTVDGVDIQGLYFQAKRGTNPPTVLMLHPLGESGRTKGWLDLAEQLSAKFSVLTFDFRGHGQSTEVQPEFWKYNQGYVKGAANSTKTSVSFKDFEKHSYLTFVNDIAAARGFLDRKNDTGACNTANLFVIGAETGATLGAVWLKSEWHRYRLIKNPMFFVPQVDTRPEGMDILGCVWLSMQSKLGSRQPLAIGKILEVPLTIRATPMAFLHSDGDASGKKLATDLLKNLKTGREKERHKFTVRVEIKGSKLTGIGLLQRSLNTDQQILDYMDNIYTLKSNEYATREYRKTDFVWRFGLQNVPAKTLVDSNNLIWDNYERFAR